MPWLKLRIWMRNCIGDALFACLNLLFRNDTRRGVIGSLARLGTLPLVWIIPLCVTFVIYAMTQPSIPVEGLAVDYVKNMKAQSNRDLFVIVKLTVLGVSGWAMCFVTHIMIQAYQYAYTGYMASKSKPKEEEECPT